MILVMTLAIFVTNVLGCHWDFAKIDKVSQTIHLLPSIWLSVVNDLLFCVMLSYAMAFVIRARFVKSMKLAVEPGEDWLGGDFLVTTLILFANSDKIASSD